MPADEISLDGESALLLKQRFGAWRMSSPSRPFVAMALSSPFAAIFSTFMELNDTYHSKPNLTASKVRHFAICLSPCSLSMNLQNTA